MKLIQILHEAKWDNVKSLMHKHFTECSQKYFPQYTGKLTPPEFEIKVHGKNAGWFLPYYNRQIPDRSKIGINPDFIGDADMFKGIMYHETIHYFQYHTYSYPDFVRAHNKGHDGFFIEMMKKINAGEGKELVTITQETNSIDKALTGEFWVYGIKTRKGLYAFAHTKRENPAAINYLTKLVKSGLYEDGFVFKTDTYRYKIGTFGTRGFKFAVPDDQQWIPDLSAYSVKKG